MRRLRLLAVTGKKGVRLLALASAVSAVPSAGVALADVSGTHSGGYRQIANLTGPNIPFFKAPPGSLVADIVFVDPALHRVYLADQSNVKPGTGGRIVGAVDAWDTRTFKFVGAMFGGFTGLAGFPQSFDTEGPDGVLADNLGHIWAGNGDNRLMVGDARTMKLIKVINTGYRRAQLNSPNSIRCSVSSSRRSASCRLTTTMAPWRWWIRKWLRTATRCLPRRFGFRSSAIHLAWRSARAATCSSAASMAAR